MKSSWIIQAGPKSDLSVLRRDKKKRYRIEVHVFKEAEIGVIQPEAKEHLKPPESTWKARRF